MGFWSSLGKAVGDAAGVKMIKSGSDAMISRHTEFQALSVNSRLRGHADALLEKYFKSTPGEPINEFEAALLKLGIYFANAESAGDSHMQALIADSIGKIRDAGEGRIRAAISLEVMSQTGA